MKKSFVVSVFVDVEIPDKKIEKTIKDYRECINETAGINDIMQKIAWNEARYGGFCEGVGENGEDFMANVTEDSVEEDI